MPGMYHVQQWYPLFISCPLVRPVIENSAHASTTCPVCVPWGSTCPLYGPKTVEMWSTNEDKLY